MNADLDWSKFANMYYETCLKKLPTISPSQAIPLVCAGKIAISVCSVIYYTVVNTIFSLKQGQGLKTSVAQLYRNSPLVHPPLPEHM